MWPLQFYVSVSSSVCTCVCVHVHVSIGTCDVYVHVDMSAEQCMWRPEENLCHRSPGTLGLLAFVCGGGLLWLRQGLSQTWNVQSIVRLAESQESSCVFSGIANMCHHTPF